MLSIIDIINKLLDLYLYLDLIPDLPTNFEQMTSAFVIYNDIKTADEKNLTAWNCQKQTIFRLKTNGLNINANELLPGRWILVDFSSGSEPCILRICEEQEHKLLDTRIRDNIFEVCCSVFSNFVRQNAR